MINVVGAIIRNSENKILIAQRNLSKNQGGLWEFPGGKIEDGETKEEAIVREIKEELDMDIKCNSLFDEHVYEYPDKSINLIVLNCSMLGESYKALEHEDLRWVAENEMDNFEFAPADIYFVEKIKEDWKRVF